MLTFHYDNARLGWNSEESVISPASLKRGGFGERWHASTDGLVWGSALLVHKLKTSRGPIDVIFAATDHNSVYALDARNGQRIWVRSQLAKPLSEAQFLGTWGSDGVHGILSTPVIDAKSQSLYVCGLEAEGLRQYYAVWSLDLLTGRTRSGYPVRLKAADRGTKFECGQLIQRGALSLVSGRLIVPFGGRGDVPPWRGWVVSLDAAHPDRPPLSVCTSPYTDGAGVWSGGGVSADERGDLFAATGNGTFDVPAGGACAAECVLRLKADKPRLGLSLKKPDSYTPSNFAFLDEQDEDLGGATPNVLPPIGGKAPRLLFIGGKDGVAYLLDRDNLAGIGGEIQKTRIFSQPSAIYHEGIRSTSAYWDAGSSGKFIYVAGDEPGPSGDHGMVALRLAVDPATGLPGISKSWTLSRDFDGPSSPVVSSQGDKNGVVWVVETGNGFRSSLLAYDALTGALLYDSARPGGAYFAGGRRFTSPVVCDGRVYVGARGVICFGFGEATK